VGNGSDEVLGFAFQAFFRKSGLLQFPDITYSFYPSYCRLFGIEYNTFPLTDTFEIDIELIPEVNTGIIIANPNAPTGIYLDTGQIRKILETHPDSVVLVDEAYVDFGGTSCVSMINDYPNLVVVQTLSKSRSLAGLRVGLAIASKGLVQGLERVKNSFNAYPLDSLAIAGATAAFNDKDSFERNNKRVAETRDWSMDAMKALSFYVIPSKSNFFMARHKKISAKTLYLQLKEEGILVRYFDLPRINNFLRISVGTREDMQTLIDTLQKILDR
jgi:histidinol-phosphate aminotransferase